MSETRKSDSVQVSEAGKKKLTEAKATKYNSRGKIWNYLDIGEAAKVSESTVKRFFTGTAVKRHIANSIVEALGLDLNEIIEQNEENPPPTVVETRYIASEAASEIDWCEVCGGVLAQQRETQRLRRQATERGFELNVYVPLGLVERKQQQRRSGDVPREEVCQVTEKEVITKEYDNNEFLQEVIAAQQSRRLAIIGEPGAGKTTLLQATADWIFNTNKAEDNPKSDPPFSPFNKGGLQNSKSLGLPICIPLGALQGKSLKDYLLQNWLEAALRFIEPEAVSVETSHAKSLKKLFREGKVWLLLDGVDEMAVSSPVEALGTIREQLTDWVGEARVVLTCRLNVWDVNVNNTLAGFETYRTLEFKPEQVEEFIREWFKHAAGEPTEPTLETGEPPHPTLETGEPPQPSLERVEPPQPPLVRGEEEVVSPLSKGGLRGVQLAEELLAKLKETGRERIWELVRSPLRLSLLCQIWYLQPGELPETKAGLYQRFTRYFYEWKQEQHLVSHQDDLIDELQAALGKLALAGMNSAAMFRLPRKLARQEMGESLFNLACSLGWLNLVDRDTKTDEPVYAFYHPTFQEYFAALGIDDWHFFLNHVPHNPTQGNYRIFQPQWKQVILLWLGREDVPKEQKEAFIKALTEFEDGCKDFYEYRAYFLAAVTITEFKDCILTDEIVEKIVKWGFCEFNIEKQEWRTFLDPLSEGASAVLPETDRTKAIAALVGLIGTSKNEYTRLRAAESLGKIDKDNPTAIAHLVKVIRTSKSKDTLWRAAESLGEIGKDNPRAIAALVELIGTSEDQFTCRRAAESLGKIGADNPTAIAALVKVIRTSEDEYILWQAAESLGKIDKDNPTAIAALVKVIRTSKSKDTRLWAAESLGKIDKDNPTAIAALVELIGTSENEFTIQLAAEILREIDKNNPTAIAALVELIGTSEDEFTIQRAAESLREIHKDNPTAIAAWVELIGTSEDEDTRWRAAENLGKIVGEAQMAGVVTALKDYVSYQAYENDYERFEDCYKVIWKCAQTLPYPEFYKAWHNEENPETSTVGSTPFTQSLNLAELPSLLAAEIRNSPQLLNSIHLICIDASKFIDADNPALEIYDSMLDCGLPEYENGGEPETMQKLKRYWNSLRRKSDKRLVLVFYQNPTAPGRQEFSATFLSSLSKFDGEICVISDKPNIPLQSFSPNQPNLIDDILAWLRAKGMEE